MTKMKRGFTMIELIFVIVIIGILAAVAIPKIAGVAEEARKSEYTSFMGTLNRSVGPLIWSDYIATGGSITAVTEQILKDNYTEFPTGVTLDLSGCTQPGNPPGEVGAVSTAGLPVAEIIYCINGTSTQSPRFGYGFDGNETNTSLQNN